MVTHSFRSLVVLAGLACSAGASSGLAHAEGHDHPAAMTVQEKLGHPADAKLLIIHADDLGMSHSKNVATIDAMKRGVVTSASIMMPTPWMAEAVELAKANPELDMGVHLTLTAEWRDYKWGPLLGADTVPSLVTAGGWFHDNVPDFATTADLAEIEAEVRAQIDLALKLGVDVTHLDGHMGSLLATPEIAALYLRIGQDYQLPIRVHAHYGENLSENPDWQAAFAAYPANLTTIGGAPPATYPDGMVAYYNAWLRNLEAGLSMMVLHLGFDGPEMQAITVDHPLWGATWREIDYDWAMSAETKKIIAEEGITLINYRIIRDRLIRGEP